MMRRERRPDGSQVVWTDRVVRVYDDQLKLVEVRPLTVKESAEFETWADTQPDGQARRAMLHALTAQAAREESTASQLATATTATEIVAVLTGRPASTAPVEDTTLTDSKQL